MSRRSSTPIEELLAGLAALMKPPPDSRTRRGFEQYLELFLRWNRIHRMTALSPAGVVRDLFLDSLLFLQLLPAAPFRMADLGAGAGIPGLPLRLASPGIALTLVESRRKRVSFLRAVQRELVLDDVQVLEGRAEELVGQVAGLAGAFDVVVARAVGDPASLLPVASKYLRAGGLFVVSGPPTPGPQAGLDPVRLPSPFGRGFRTFLRAIKES